ncbi:class I SAM-dependent methyltransferase [Streptomyces sp. 35G-GA-8]|nr:class I SAM-dependent methyltransferase [Streptomyces sp. 35G-GA-8]MCL7382477.1 class I SAM-dependent methyltransferase [Streptomyces sp. 35G-GA-8]
MTESWDSIADWYAELVQSGSALHGFGRDSLLARLPELLIGQRVLDLGCGEGIIARALAARGATVWGIDSSPRMIKNARTAEKAGPAVRSSQSTTGARWRRSPQLPWTG